VTGTAPREASTAAEGATAPDVSVIVPVRNSEAGLASLLARLEEQTLARDAYEVIVVDDRSDDDTAGVAERSGVARVVRAERHGGSYVARNLGARASRGAVLAFTDSDCLPDARWLESGLAAVRDGGADLVAGEVDVPLGGNPSAAALVDFSRSLDQERCALKEGFGATANLLVTRSVFERVGGFNERLISGGDTEFGHRATAAGARLAYEPGVIVVHEPRARARQLARKGFRLGYGAAQQRHHAEGPLRDRVRIWTRPGAYKPTARVYGTERLDKVGYRPTRLKYLQMLAVEYFSVRLPIAAGNFVGSIREGRA
jgi:glycosyltransferase involved in cell wall biosynthesis